MAVSVFFTIYAQELPPNSAAKRNLKGVENAAAARKETSGACGVGVQPFVDPARVLDRQVISGEVTGGRALATGREIGIGLAFVSPKLRAGIN